MCPCKNNQRHVRINPSRTTSQSTTKKMPIPIWIPPQKIHNRPMDPWNKINLIHPDSRQIWHLVQ